MKKLTIYMLFLFVVFSSCTKEKYCLKQLKDSNGYNYETVTNDPAKVRIYTLENGLKVYLSYNANEPRIMTLIGIKAGSTNDPVETTGLAHYFEHIMFKGTSSFGTANWEMEKPLLDSISNLFEIYRNERNEVKRKSIYAQIDKLSVEASQYAVPNEYDKMMTEIGARYTNAFTSLDQTAYMNDIPANELKKWLTLEFNRFGDVALRLFHTELETVYEEFNMYQDRDWSRAYTAYQSAMFPKSPLGRDVIGYPEHLKNPSMVNILKFKETWYVPNNMVIALSGDFDMEKTIKMIDETFGSLKSKPLPEIAKIIEDPIVKPIEKEVVGPDAESLMIGYRVDSNTPEDKQLLYIAGRILNNGTAGLIDIDLVQDQKVLDAYAYSDFVKDYGMLTISVNPKNDQTLEQARDIALEEIEKLKKGDFPEWMPTAIANQYRLNMLRNFQGNWRVYNFLDAFINDKKWTDILAFADELEKINKQQVIDYANKHFADNYVVVYKRSGEATDLVKVAKPSITPIIINRKDQSQFYTDWVKIPADTIKPEFIDFSKAFETVSLKEGVDLNYIKNNDNEFFTHYYLVDVGKSHNLKTPIAVDFLPYIGTKKRSATELKQELFRYGLSTFVWSSNDRSRVYISGLNRNYKKGLELMEEILTESEPDTAAFRKYAERIIKERNDAKLNQDNILWDGLRNYAIYGAKSPFNDVLTNEELKAINPEELTEMVKNLFSYPHRVLYYGPSPMAEVEMAVKEFHKTSENLNPIPEKKQYPEVETAGKQVLFADYDMSQVNLVLHSKGEPFSQDLYIKSQLFNQYFGSSMSSMVFQEVREAQGMAYSAWLGYNSPNFKEKSFYLMGFIGTQTDKLEMATTTIERLLNNLIENQKSFNISRKAIMNTIATERIQDEDLFFQWLYNTDLGINYDIRKDFYEAAENAKMDDLKVFFDTYIKNKPYTYMVIGNSKAIDKKVLSRMGTVKQLTLEELFGY